MNQDSNSLSSELNFDIDTNNRPPLAIYEREHKKITHQKTQKEINGSLKPTNLKNGRQTAPFINFIDPDNKRFSPDSITQRVIEKENPSTPHSLNIQLTNTNNDTHL